MLKVSIIVPTYNIQNDVRRCLESIINQTYRNIEIIVVDDGSKDETPAILQCMAEQDGRIKVIYKENGGVTSARLRGLVEATGEYIGFVDGDDYIEPEMFERLVKNAIKYKADISHCGYRMVFHNREDLYYGTGRLVLQDYITGLKDLLSGTYVEPGLWNKLYHRRLIANLLKENLMDKTIKINEDLLMNYHLFKQSKVSVFEDVCPYHYIVRADSAANQALNEHRLLDPIKVAKKILIYTKGEPEVYIVAEQKYVRQLISLATRSLHENPELIRPNRTEARRELQRVARGIIFSHRHGIKMRIMVFWVALWPASYNWVHTIYAKVRGFDKIYNLE